MGNTPLACQAPASDNISPDVIECSAAIKITLTDILRAIFDVSMSEEEMRAVFVQVDTDNDGYWEKSEMTAALISMGKATVEFINAVNCISDEVMVSFDEIKGLVNGTISQLSYSSRRPHVRALCAVSQSIQREIADALEQAPMVHCSGDVIILTTPGLPAHFESLLYPLEKAAGIQGSIKYAIYQDRSGNSGLWRVHAVVEKDQTQSCDRNTMKAVKARLQFPQSWRNRKGTDLFRNCGIDDIVSVCRHGCIGTSKSREGAIAMATRSVELSLMRQAKAVSSAQSVESESMETMI